MNTIYLLLILSFTFIYSTNSNIKSNSTYISDPKKVEVERFYNFGSKIKLKHNLRSSLLPANITSQILNYDGNGVKQIAYDEMIGEYKINNFYGKVWKIGKLIYYEIFHSVIEASPQKLKTETIDCNRKWYTLFIKEYCYKKIRRVFRAPTAKERKIIKNHLIKISKNAIEQRYPTKIKTKN